MVNIESVEKGKRSQVKEIIYEKALGSLLGVAYGDAMGMPSSLMSPETIRKQFPGGIKSLLPAPRGHIIHDGLKAGQVTDDTQQTLLLVDLFLEEKRFTREGVARKLLEWAKSLNAYESMILGPSTLKALKMIEDGAALESSGSMGDTNGAAMKIAPVGIVHPGKFNEVVEDVAEVCLPTHNTDIAISGASAVACAVSAAMAGATLDGVVGAFFYGIDKGSKFGNRWYGASIARRAEEALKIVKSNGDEQKIWRDLYDYIGTGVAMSESVPSALALVVYYDGNPVKAAMAAANIGGDCDTVVLIVTKGPEWSLVKKVFAAGANEFDGIEFDTSIVRMYDLQNLGWYPGDMHHHSFYSDGVQPPWEVARAMKGVGLSWGILTDHNTIAGAREWLTAKSRVFLPILGCEITTEASDSSFGPLVLVEANGRIPGETARVAGDGTVGIEIKVFANRPLLKSRRAIRVIVNGETAREIPTDSTYALDVKLHLTTKEDGWMVVECFGEWPMYAITDPIYLDYPPYSHNAKQEWKDPKQAVEWNRFLSHPQINMQDGPTSWKNTGNSTRHANRGIDPN